MNTIYVFFIIFWFAASVFHSFDTRETGYSKIMMWLAFMSVSALIVGFQI